MIKHLLIGALIGVGLLFGFYCFGSNDFQGLVNNDYFLKGQLYQKNSYGEIYYHDLSVAVPLTASTTYTKLTTFDTNGQSSYNVVSDVANDRIIINRPGKYKVQFSFSSEFDTNDVTVKTTVFLNDVEQHNIHTERKLKAISISASSGSGIINVTSTPAYLDARTRVDIDCIATAVYGNLNIFYLGE